MRSEPVRFPDDGFSVVELIVSLAVISAAMAGLGVFFVNGNLAVSHQRDQRQAVQVAAGAIEQVRGLKGSSLLSGRGPVKAQEQWSRALNGPYRSKVKRYLDSTQVASDDEIKDVTSTLGDEAPLPTTPQSIKVGNATFTREIIVGKCEIYFMRSDDCVNPAIGTPPSNQAEILKYFRVMVLVTWTGRNCTGAKCAHISSTLIASEPVEPTFDSKAGVPELVTTDMYFYVGVQTQAKLDVDHGQQPNTWSWVGLPSWLTINAKSGLVIAMPTAVGVTSSTVTVKDSLDRSDTGTVRWHGVTPPTITVPAASTVRVGQAVNLTVIGANGVPNRFFSSADIPSELDLNSTTGAITGVFTTPGVKDFTVTVKDANGQTANGTVKLTVVDLPLALAVSAQKFNLNAAASLTIAATGGYGKYAYTATGLPAGMTLQAATGVLAGTPTVAGRYLPTITVTDEAGKTVATTFELIVDTTLGLTFTAPAMTGLTQAAKVGDDVSLTLATNVDLLLLKNETFETTGLPPGLTMRGNGTISGKPTAAGTYLVTVTATSKLPPQQTAVLTFVWTIS
jgi:type II secretory pathway pseudopilin PulG